ncbi:MAG: hypothetical protein ACREQW_08035, partial [Candidatus Binatia bacterium]
MSRVFDALTRANEEKKDHSTSSNNGKHGTLEAAPLNGDAANSPWRLDDHKDAPVVLPLPTATPAFRSWREKFEELFFGWDLKRYK